MKYCILLISFAALAAGCHNHWTDEERKEFECNCAKTDTFKDEVFNFVGFENNEFDSVLIREYNDTLLVDSFRMYVFPAQSPDDKRDKNRSGHTGRAFHIKYRYEFIIPGEQPYVLSDMKMVMHPQYTMAGEGYGCVMRRWALDGVKFHEGNPCIAKRDTNHP